MRVKFAYNSLMLFSFSFINLILVSFTYQYQDFVIRENLEGSGLSLVQYKGTQSKVQIPAQYQGKSIIDISGYNVVRKGAFQNSNVTYVVVPETIKSIGYWEFGACKNLLQIDLPRSLKNIASYAFVDCINLETITLPEGISGIGNYVFYGCSKLSVVTIESIKPPFLEDDGSNLFLGTSPSLKIFVPSSSVIDYQNAQGWSQYATKIFPITKK